MISRLRAVKSIDEGFTLIELLIVIVILGILAGIVVFAVGGVTNRGTVAACKADVASVTTAAEAYYAQNGTYAANVAALVPGFLHASPTGETIVYTVNAGPPASVTISSATCP